MIPNRTCQLSLFFADGLLFCRSASGPPHCLRAANHRAGPIRVAPAEVDSPAGQYGQAAPPRPGPGRRSISAPTPTSRGRSGVASANCVITGRPITWPGGRLVGRRASQPTEGRSPGGAARLRAARREVGELGRDDFFARLEPAGRRARGSHFALSLALSLCSPLGRTAKAEAASVRERVRHCVRAIFTSTSQMWPRERASGAAC